MKLFNSDCPDIHIGPIAEPDALVVMKIQPGVMDGIRRSIHNAFEDKATCAKIQSCLYWPLNDSGANSLIAFPGEFKN